MRLPVFPVLGAFLFVVVFGPFLLMFAGPALTGDPDAARVGLYLLLNVNPVAIPVLLLVLGMAWAFRFRAALPVAPAPGVASAPRPGPGPGPGLQAPGRACRPAAVSAARRTTGHRDVIVDVVAVRVDVRSGARGGQRLPAPATPRPALAFQPEEGRRAR